MPEVWRLRRRDAAALTCAAVLALTCACAHGAAGNGSASASSGAPASSSSAPSTPASIYAANLAASVKADQGIKAPFCGFPLKACPQGSYGKVSATPPKPATVGSFVEVSLQSEFQSDAVVPEVKATSKGKSIIEGKGKYPLAGGGDGLVNGWIPQPYAPNTGTWTATIQYNGHVLSVPFLMGPGGLGQKNALDLSKQVTLPVPAGKYLGVWLLEAGVRGGGTANLQAVYKSAPASTYPMHFQPMCSPQATTAPQFLVFAAPYYLTGSGTSTSCRYLFADAVPINPAHTLTGLVLPASQYNASNHYVLMALTLQKAA